MKTAKNTELTNNQKVNTVKTVMKIGDTFRYLNTEVKIIKITPKTVTFTSKKTTWRFSHGRTQREMNRNN